MWRPSAPLFPPVTGGLHCGSPGSVASHFDPGFSRQLRAGSIAAVPPSVRTASGRLLFPPVTGGLHCGAGTSITIRDGPELFPPVTGGLHCGRSGADQRGDGQAPFPASYGRAPLRRPLLSGMGGHEKTFPASYGRAPLRRPHSAPRSRQIGRLFPPVTGGLHCGTLTDPEVVMHAEAFPASYGRAPLRPFLPRLGHPRGKVSYLSPQGC